MSSLNKKSNDGSEIKLFILGRHGQGVHNVAETKFGTKNWDVSCIHPNSGNLLLEANISHMTDNHSATGPFLTEMKASFGPTHISLPQEKLKLLSRLQPFMLPSQKG
jgi:hypothetical protein